MPKFASPEQQSNELMRPRLQSGPFSSRRQRHVRLRLRRLRTEEAHSAVSGSKCIIPIGATKWARRRDFPMRPRMADRFRRAACYPVQNGHRNAPFLPILSNGRGLEVQTEPCEAWQSPRAQTRWWLPQSRTEAALDKARAGGVKRSELGPPMTTDVQDVRAADRSRMPTSHPWSRKSLVRLRRVKYADAADVRSLNPTRPLA